MDFHSFSYRTIGRTENKCDVISSTFWLFWGGKDIYLFFPHFSLAMQWDRPDFSYRLSGTVVLPGLQCIQTFVIAVTMTPHIAVTLHLFDHDVEQ